MELLIQMFKTNENKVCISELDNFAMAGIYENVGLFDPNTNTNDLNVVAIEKKILEVFNTYKSISKVVVLVKTYDKATCIMLMELQQKCYKRGIQLRVMYTNTCGFY